MELNNVNLLQSKYKSNDGSAIVKIDLMQIATFLNETKSGEITTPEEILKYCLGGQKIEGG